MSFSESGDYSLTYEIADESSLIFEFLIGNENYTDWQ